MFNKLLWMDSDPYWLSPLRGESSARVLRMLEAMGLPVDTAGLEPEGLRLLDLEKMMLRVHSRNFVSTLLVDGFCPGWWETNDVIAAQAAGAAWRGSLDGADALMRGGATVAVNTEGGQLGAGMTKGEPGSAVNDTAAAALHMLDMGASRVLIITVDRRHPTGVEGVVTTTGADLMRLAAVYENPPRSSRPEFGVFNNCMGRHSRGADVLRKVRDSLRMAQEWEPGAVVAVLGPNGAAPSSSQTRSAESRAWGLGSLVGAAVEIGAAARRWDVPLLILGGAEHRPTASTDAVSAAMIAGAAASRMQDAWLTGAGTPLGTGVRTESWGDVGTADAGAVPGASGAVIYRDAVEIEPWEGAVAVAGVGGAAPSFVTRGAGAPLEPRVGDVWVDDSGSMPVLRTWNPKAGGWVGIGSLDE